ncbi:hypothetical protein ACXYMU_03435 [Pontibacter sp. CAU 1760]
MKDENLEKLFYAIAALLVVSGVVIRILALSENQLGLHLILSGLLAGVVAILMHMKRVNESEQQHADLESKHLHKP